MKKTLLICCLVVTLLGSLAAGSACAAEKVKLRIWNTAEALANPLTEEHIASFTKKYPNVEVEFFTYPWQELRSKLLAAFAAGTAPDVLQLDTPWLPEFTEANLLEPVPAYVAADLETNFQPIGRYIVSYKGKSYGYPWWVFTNALLYNKELYRQHGLNPEAPPTTWDELRTAAHKLTKYDGDEIAQAGFLINQRILHFTDYLYNNGGAIIGEDERGIPQTPVKSTFSTPAVIETLQFLNDLYEKDKVGSPHFTNDMYQAFQKGQVGMLIEAQWLIPWTLSAAPDLDFGIAPIPTPTGEAPEVRADSWIMVVSAKSDPAVKEYAWKFLNEYVSTSQYDMLKAALSVPTRNDIVESKDLDWIESFYASYLQGATRVKPFHKQWEEIERRVEPILAEMYLGDLSPRDTAEAIDMEIESILAGY